MGIFRIYDFKYSVFSIGAWDVLTLLHEKHWFCVKRFDIIPDLICLHLPAVKIPRART